MPVEPRRICSSRLLEMWVCASSVVYVSSLALIFRESEINTLPTNRIYVDVDEICISLLCTRDQQHFFANLLLVADMKAIFLRYLCGALRLYDFYWNKHTPPALEFVNIHTIYIDYVIDICGVTFCLQITRLFVCQPY